MKKIAENISPIEGKTKHNEQSDYALIPLSQIQLNPKNYRKVFDESSIQDLAEQLKRHGVLSSLMLRPIGKDLFEVVVGERRFRAANLAGLKEVPARIEVLDDLQVLEIQLDENMNRENPHPLDEAEAIRMMLDAGYNIEEISLRLGKSKALIYNRIKLSELIVPIKEMFIANVLTIQMAIEMASLSQESQTELFGKYLKDWKKKDFRLLGLSDKLNQFKFDLKYASFDTNDSTLIQKAGECFKCPFNSATLKSLFPEMAKSSLCSNKKCFSEKTAVSLERNLDILSKNKSISLLITSSILSDIESAALAKFPELMKLPGKLIYEIDRCDKPLQPKEADFQVEKKEGGKELDDKKFAKAIEEYKKKSDTFNQLYESGDIKTGLLVNGNKAMIVYYYTAKRKSGSTGVTAKEVQEAIKAGSVTPELLQQEIKRLETKEVRSKELDLDKLQKKVHESFVEQNKDLKSIAGLTKADHAAARWIIFEAMDYRVREDVIKALFPKNFSILDKTKKFDLISKLTEKEFAFLIRNTLAGKSESKSPEYATGYFLYQNAIDAALDVKALEAEQNAIAQTREQRVKERIADLKKQIKELSKIKKAPVKAPKALA